MKKFLLPIIILALGTACNLQQEVDLDLPEFEPQIVVESYLQPGQPYLLVLTESVGYFEDIRLQFLHDATVSIEFEGGSVELGEFGIPLDFQIPGGAGIDTSLLQTLGPIVGDSLFVYTSFALVPELYEKDFTLTIKTADGRDVTATTHIPAPVSLDTMEYRFNDDSAAFVLTKFQDDGEKVNFYRLQLDEWISREVEDSNGQTVLEATRREVFDFNIDDDIENGEQITVGTAFDYQVGDTLVSTLYHIPPEYYYFLETSTAAIIANLSPFGQPASIQSNIEGGSGIFTGYSIRNRAVIIGE
ncbi:MAG: DUF4249 domain-containing protein [Bacteroidota bacterium]